MTRRATPWLAALGLAAGLAGCPAQEAPDARAEPLAARCDYAALTDPASAAAEVQRCAEVLAAQDRRPFLDWAAARLAGATGIDRAPTPGLLAVVAATLDAAADPAEDRRTLQIDLGRALAARGDAAAAARRFTAVLAATPAKPGLADARITGEAHLALAAQAKDRADRAARCEHLAVAVEVDARLRRPIREFFAAGCAAKDRPLADAALCVRLLGARRSAQAQLCVQEAIAARTTGDGEDFDRLVVAVYTGLAAVSTADVQAIVRLRPSLGSRLRRIDACAVDWIRRPAEVGSDGLYFALSRSPRVPAAARPCYLQAAAAICLATLAANADCVAPEALIDLARSGDPALAAELTGPLLVHRLVEVKSRAYDQLNAVLRKIGRCESANTETLFYLHYALAELYLRHPEREVKTSRLLNRTGQVCRMREMYRRTFKRDIAPADEPRGAAEVDCAAIQPSICVSDTIAE